MAEGAYDVRIPLSRLEFEYLDRAMQVEGFPGLLYGYCKVILLREASKVLEEHERSADC